MANKMNPEVKAKWTDALRSGDYKQTKSVLHSQAGGFCCLGVLCDLHRKDTMGLPWSREGKAGQFYEGEETHLPLVVCEWAGLDSHNPPVPVATPRGWDFLSNINDLGFSFAEIADLIDARL